MKARGEEPTMTEEIDLRRLADMSSSDRAFLSVYLACPESLEWALRRLEDIGRLLGENQDEAEHLRQNERLFKEYLDKNPFVSGSLCVFCCWLLDFLEAFVLDVPVDDVVRLDSSPYIRPLAELRDEYENFAVVAADNKSARVFLVAAGRAEDEETVKGNIKNHVKVGGWSQRRYERRRDKEFERYAKDVADALSDLDKKEEFQRIILVGGKEAIAAIEGALPERLAKRLVGEKALDLGKGEEYVNKEICDLFFTEERKEEMDFWRRVKERYMRGEPAVIGIQDVLYASKIGRVEKAIVNRHAAFPGVRCRECEGVNVGKLERCPECGSASVFSVDLVNEVVELLSRTSALMEFAENIKGLEEVGNIAAILRY
jgi:peptide chain release factor subunit 1